MASKKKAKHSDNLVLNMKDLIENVIKNKKLTVFFKDAVDEIRDGAPRYYELIKQPMYLNKILDKLKNKEYRTPGEIYADFKLIGENCRTYNTDVTNKVRIKAGELDKFIDDQWKKNAEALLASGVDVDTAVLDYSLVNSEILNEVKMTKEQKALLGSQDVKPKESRFVSPNLTQVLNERNHVGQKFPEYPVQQPPPKQQRRTTQPPQNTRPFESQPASNMTINLSALSQQQQQPPTTFHLKQTSTYPSQDHQYMASQNIPSSKPMDPYGVYQPPPQTTFQPTYQPQYRPTYQSKTQPAPKQPTYMDTYSQQTIPKQEETSFKINLSQLGNVYKNDPYIPPTIPTPQETLPPSQPAQNKFHVSLPPSGGADFSFPPYNKEPAYEEPPKKTSSYPMQPQQYPMSQNVSNTKIESENKIKSEPLPPVEVKKKTVPEETFPKIESNLPDMSFDPFEGNFSTIAVPNFSFDGPQNNGIDFSPLDINLDFDPFGNNKNDTKETVQPTAKRADSYEQLPLFKESSWSPIQTFQSQPEEKIVEEKLQEEKPEEEQESVKQPKQEEVMEDLFEEEEKEVEPKVEQEIPKVEESVKGEPSMAIEEEPQVIPDEDNGIGNENAMEIENEKGTEMEIEEKVEEVEEKEEEKEKSFHEEEEKEIPVAQEDKEKETPQQEGKEREVEKEEIKKEALPKKEDTAMEIEKEAEKEKPKENISTKAEVAPPVEKVKKEPVASTTKTQPIPKKASPRKPSFEDDGHLMNDDDDTVNNMIEDLMKIREEESNIGFPEPEIVPPPKNGEMKIRVEDKKENKERKDLKGNLIKDSGRKSGEKEREEKISKKVTIAEDVKYKNGDQSKSKRDEDDDEEQYYKSPPQEPEREREVVSVSSKIRFDLVKIRKDYENLKKLKVPKYIKVYSKHLRRLGKYFKDLAIEDDYLKKLKEEVEGLVLSDKSFNYSRVMLYLFSMMIFCKYQYVIHPSLLKKFKKIIAVTKKVYFYLREVVKLQSTKFTEEETEIFDKTAREYRKNLNNFVKQFKSQPKPEPEPSTQITLNPFDQTTSAFEMPSKITIVQSSAGAGPRVVSKHTIPHHKKDGMGVPLVKKVPKVETLQTKDDSEEGIIKSEMAKHLEALRATYENKAMFDNIEKHLNSSWKTLEKEMEIQEAASQQKKAMEEEKKKNGAEELENSKLESDNIFSTTSTFSSFSLQNKQAAKAQDWRRAGSSSNRPNLFPLEEERDQPHQLQAARALWRPDPNLFKPGRPTLDIYKSSFNPSMRNIEGSLKFTFKHLFQAAAPLETKVSFRFWTTKHDPMIIQKLQKRKFEVQILQTEASDPFLNNFVFIKLVLSQPREGNFAHGKTKDAIKVSVRNTMSIESFDKMQSLPDEKIRNEIKLKDYNDILPLSNVREIIQNTKFLENLMKGLNPKQWNFSPKLAMFTQYQSSEDEKSVTWAMNIFTLIEDLEQFKLFVNDSQLI